MIANAGHSAFDLANASALVAATDRFQVRQTVGLIALTATKLLMN